ncbi:MAG: magnesium transporter [Kiritimatiellae bacterium]|jgi:magnesium transporter|nr:magnesium transporter [Kiritimatiellia bacterium]
MPIEETTYDFLQDLIEKQKWDKVAELLSELHTADIAEIINTSPSNIHKTLFNILPQEAKPDVLAELEHIAEADIIESLTNGELSDIVEEMSPDDAADIIAELTDKRSEEILNLMEHEESKEVRRLLTYKDDTAGGIMTTDVVAMQENQTVQEAINELAYIDEEEPFFFAYIVDKQHKLIGYLDIWELIRTKDRQQKLINVAHTDITSVDVDTDQEEVARQFSKYDLKTIPVVDKDNHLVGRITADDVMDVIEEEASEDIFMLAGSHDDEIESVSPFTSCRLRLPWLFLTLAGGFVTSFLLNKFNILVTGSAMALVAFVPIILGMGGNTGLQASTLVVRSIALGRFKNKNIYKHIQKEILTGIMMGLICGLIIAAWAYFIIGNSPAAINTYKLAGVVGIALCSAMIFATLFGSIVPIVLDKFNIDPAIASGPFISSANDISALLIYFGVTASLLRMIL